jgi:hypothetical protein
MHIDLEGFGDLTLSRCLDYLLLGRLDMTLVIKPVQSSLNYNQGREEILEINRGWGVVSVKIVYQFSCFNGFNHFARRNQMNPRGTGEPFVNRHEWK